MKSNGFIFLCFGYACSDFKIQSFTIIKFKNMYNNNDKSQNIVIYLNTCDNLLNKSGEIIRLYLDSTK